MSGNMNKLRYPCTGKRQKKVKQETIQSKQISLNEISLDNGTNQSEKNHRTFPKLFVTNHTFKNTEVKT